MARDCRVPKSYEKVVIVKVSSGLTVFVFGREHRTQMWLSELRCIGYSPVTVSSVVELIVQVYEDTTLAGSTILLPPKIS